MDKTNSDSSYYGKADSIKESLLKYAIKIPGFRSVLLGSAQQQIDNLSGNTCQSIEIVSHCWQYHRFLEYQLQSLLAQKIAGFKIIYTVFYNDSDQGTAKLLEHYGKQSSTSIEWNWQQLPKEKLFRRSIGRNMAAEATNADWIWFTDCDVIFGENCFLNLHDALQGVNAPLVFPATEYRSKPLPASHPILSDPNMSVADFNLQDFIATPIDRATGPLQIVHGDAARALGYCKQFKLYQKPAESWCKATEDRVFRWVLCHEGQALNIEPIMRIQHIEKGRYKKNALATVRKQFQALKN